MSHKKTVKSLYDETTDIYDRRYQKIQDVKYEIILRNISITTGQVILEVGCGTGNFFQFLERNECNKYGIDFSIESLKKYRKKISNRQNQVLCADVEFLPFREKYFDIIFAITILQNLPDPIKSLEEMKNICKQNGLLILSLLKKKFQMAQIENLLKDAKLTPTQIIDDNSCEDIIVIVENKKWGNYSNFREIFKGFK
ncbi:MAG: class I SAM-dependent methyltransferase [Candidatus Helarchaeota archaeon]|nr:class I SAM-dependent methyltransferase [Candidatus Helarchaeota archaeon]